jgi:hypothetical protein
LTPRSAARAAGGLRECLDHQDSWQDRCAREVTLEELLADRDVLAGDETAARLVLRDGVDEDEGIPIRDA